MRKILVPLFMATCAVTACSKKETSLLKEPSLHLISGTDSTLGDGMLEFNSMAEYELFLDDSAVRATVISSTAYSPLSNITNSLATLRGDTSVATETAYNSHPNLADTLYEDRGLLLEILNQYKMVGMGDYYVKVDLQQEKVFTILKTIPESINTLRTATISTPNITHYPLDEEVVPIIFNLVTCFQPWAGREQDGDPIACDSYIRSKCNIEYQTAGIYFSLLGKIKNQKRKRLNWWADYANPNSYISYVSYDYKVRCGFRDASGFIPVINSHAKYTLSENNSKYKFRPYGGMRALRNYYFSMTTEGCGGTLTWTISY